MGLREYFKKRRFSQTPEPKGKIKRAPHHKKLAFVVHEHDATRLHYDLRLELDGVLKSWAVPKGPSLDPHEHHLAVHTEDHPYEYRTFEGVIPKGNYGAGNMIIWDQGWYEARQGNQKESEKTLTKEYKAGHITFVLHGQKLKGEFALIKLKNSDDPKAWLLIKKGDEFATTKDITAQDRSVKSNQKVTELGGGTLPDLSAYPRVRRPWQVDPMLATLVDAPFDRDNWLFEIKWDGYRAIAAKHRDQVELYSRNHTDFTKKYPVVAEAVRSLAHDVILDGEVVVVDKNGRAHFEWLQHYTPDTAADASGSLQYFVFDILWYDGRDVRTMPLAARKQLLQTVLPPNDPLIKISSHVEASGLKLFNEMRRQGLEGMVAKNSASTYRENIRSGDWLKVKTHLRQEFVIGGFTEPRGGRKHLGSLLVGYYKQGEFIYCGHSGGGIPDTLRKQLRQKLDKIERKTSPFESEPKPNAPVHWVRPDLVCEMSFAEWTAAGTMRQPQFEGLRTDKAPREVTRERARPAKPLQIKTTEKPMSQPAKKLELTHLEKVFFPKHRYTKGDVIKYYESIAEYILPYLKDRPCSLNRMPDGIKGFSFYQKNHEHLPDWVPSTDIFSESNNEKLHWIVGNGLDALLYMVQLGCIEINPWNSRVGQLNKPDWIVIDLDPEGISFPKVVQVANTVREVCDEWNIPAYPKTSGKTGIHIYIPLGARYKYEQAKNLAHLIALEVNKREPKITSVERMPKKRQHKIYLDFLQNREGQTLAAPYSLRPTPDASVSMPLHWDEVKPTLKPSDFTIKNALARLRQTGDLWKPVVGTGVDLAKTLQRVEKSNQ